MIQSHHNHQDLKARTFFFLPPIHYAAIFHKIYGVPGHSLEIRLYFHLPPRHTPLKQQMEKRVRASFLWLCGVSCQQRCNVYKHFLIHLVMQLWENGGMHNKMQSISVFSSEFSKCLAAYGTLKDNFIIICFSKFLCFSSIKHRISTAKKLKEKTEQTCKLQQRDDFWLMSTHRALSNGLPSNNHLAL